jgi:hypothetical protein
MKDEGKAILLPASCDAGKNHALAQFLLSRVFNWNVVDVGFPTR